MAGPGQINLSLGMEIPGAGAGPWITEVDLVVPEPVVEEPAEAEPADTPLAPDVSSDHTAATSANDTPAGEQKLPESAPEQTEELLIKRIPILEEAGFKLEECVEFDEDHNGYFTDPQILDLLVVAAKEKARDTTDLDPHEAAIDVLVQEGAMRLKAFKDAAGEWSSVTESQSEQAVGRLRLRLPGLAVKAAAVAESDELLALKAFRQLLQQERGAGKQVSRGEAYLALDGQMRAKLEQWAREMSVFGENTVRISSKFREEYFRQEVAHQDIISFEEECEYLSVIAEYSTGTYVITFFEQSDGNDLCRVQKISKLARRYLERDLQTLVEVSDGKMGPRTVGD